jgi:hypothetical protein
MVRTPEKSVPNFCQKCFQFLEFPTSRHFVKSIQSKHNLLPAQQNLQKPHNDQQSHWGKIQIQNYYSLVCRNEAGSQNKWQKEIPLRDEE